MKEPAKPLRGYVAIIRGSTGYIPYARLGVKAEEGFARLVANGNVAIVAEVSDVPAKKLNEISGYCLNGRPSNKIPLKDLTDRLNSGELSDFNAQEELNQLCMAD